MPQYVWGVVSAVAAIVICFLVLYLSHRRDEKKEEPVGTLHIVDDPDDGAYLFLELDASPDELYSRKQVVFYVDNMPYEVMTPNEARQANGLDATGRTQ